jgi:hypothetical protein
MFEKIVNKLKDIPNEPTMYELGFEFLHLYDGKFNYPQGYTVSNFYFFLFNKFLVLI